MTTPSKPTETYRAMIERAEQHERLARDWRRLAELVAAPQSDRAPAREESQDVAIRSRRDERVGRHAP